MPKVTVIIPTWNWSSVLPFSIASVQRQTFRDWELWVVGDGCTDDSGTVVSSIAAGDPRVHWLNLEKNHGQQAWPNNEGLRRGSGLWAAYLGHDDLWLPDHLETLLAIVESSRADVAYGVVASVEPDGSVRRAAPEWSPGGWMPPSGVLHARKDAIDIGGWGDFRRLTMEPESDLWLRLHQAGRRFSCSDHVSVIKFSAARRKDVYRERPCAEQRAWTACILSEPHLAQRLARQIAEGGHGRRPLWQRRLWAAIPWRLKKILRRLRGAQAPEHELGQSYQDFTAERRRFKGLPPPPAP